MEVQNLKISSREELLPRLEKKVFHVTPKSNYQIILDSGGLHANKNNEFRSPFGNTTNGFFRLRNCISFFDYRIYGSKKWEEHAYKCMPTQVFYDNQEAAFFFLKEEYFKNLVSWEKWKQEEAWSNQVVPHIEAGFENFVPLSHISEIILVKNEEPPAILGFLPKDY
jgi:hypothetical protein